MAKNNSEDFNMPKPVTNPRTAIRNDVSASNTNLADPESWGTDPADPPF